MRLHKILPYLPFLQRLIRKPLVSKTLRFPGLLSLELTNYCNASCIMCPRGRLTRRQQHMDFALFKKVINDCQSKPLKKINLFWFGESLVYPHFLDSLRYIKKTLPGVKVLVSTNGDLLTENISRPLLSEQLISYLNIDLDGVQKKTAEKIRPGTKFERVQKNIFLLLAVRKELQCSKPEIRITMIDMPENHHEVADFQRFWQGKVDKVDVNQFNSWLGEMSTTPEPGIGFDFPCEHPWHELTIAADGRASLCCLDFDCQTVVGDSNTTSLEEIWQGSLLTGYREKMLQLDYKGTICQNCNAFIFQKKSLWRSLFLQK